MGRHAGSEWICGASVSAAAPVDTLSSIVGWLSNATERAWGVTVGRVLSTHTPTHFSTAVEELFSLEFDLDETTATVSTRLIAWDRDLSRLGEQGLVPIVRVDDLMTCVREAIALVVSPEGQLGKVALLIELPSPLSHGGRIPSGNESGANQWWQPGGHLPNGNS